MGDCKTCYWEDCCNKKNDKNNCHYAETCPECEDNYVMYSYEGKKYCEDCIYKACGIEEQEVSMYVYFRNGDYIGNSEDGFDIEDAVIGVKYIER